MRASSNKIGTKKHNYKKMSKMCVAFFKKEKKVILIIKLMKCLPLLMMWCGGDVKTSDRCLI